MYKIMLADDEGIVIDSLKFIIEKLWTKLHYRICTYREKGN